MIVDTQIVFWLAEEPKRLSVAAREALEQAELRDEPLAISDKTLWELAMMLHRGFVTVNGSMSDFLRAVEDTFVVLPITGAIAEQSVLFSRNFPGDPADRIIAATAMVYGQKLITADESIRKSGEVPCIW